MTRWWGCQREAEMLRILRLGTTAEAVEHLQNCAACREAFTIAELFKETTESEGQDLPDPGRIYWRALLLQRRALAERATQPIRWVQRVTLAAVTGLTLAAVVALWRVTDLVRLTRFWMSTSSESHIASAAMLGFSMLAVSIVIWWWTA